MKHQYELRKRTSKGAVRLLAFSATEYQAKKLAAALSYVLVQTDALELTLHVVTAAGESCVTSFKYGGKHGV